MKSPVLLAAVGEIAITGLLAQTGGPEWLPFVGNLAGILIFALLTFGYMRTRDNALTSVITDVKGAISDGKLSINQAVDRIEAMRRDNAETNGRVMDLVRDHIKTTADLANALNALTARVDRLDRPQPGGRFGG